MREVGIGPAGNLCQRIVVLSVVHRHSAAQAAPVLSCLGGGGRSFAGTMVRHRQADGCSLDEIGVGTEAREDLS